MQVGLLGFVPADAPGVMCSMHNTPWVYLMVIIRVRFKSIANMGIGCKDSIGHLDMVILAVIGCGCVAEAHKFNLDIAE